MDETLPQPDARTRNPLRAVFVIDTLTPGAGTENQLALLLDRFDPARIRPSLVFLREPPPDAPRTGAPATVLGVRRLAAPGGMAAVLRLRRLLRRERAGVVVTFFRDANLVGTAAARLAGVPVVSTRRNLGYWQTPGEIRLLRILNRGAALIAVNAEAVRTHTLRSEGVSSGRVRVVPNAVDLERFRPVSAAERAARRERLGLPGDGVLLGCVANLRPVKGHDVLLRAFAAMDTGPARLALAGTGELEGALRRRSGELGVADRVHFLGSRGDVPALLSAFDLVVSASLSEGLSNAILEAMAAGLPVVATAVGGNPELVVPGETGELVPAEDPPALARALAGLVADREGRERRGREGRARAEARHAPATVIAAWSALLEEAARGN